MKKLLALAFALALVPAFVPAKANSALTLAQRVAKLEAKLACVSRTPVFEFNDFAGYGVGPGPTFDPLASDNGVNTYSNGDPGAPDQLTDEGFLTGLDLNFGGAADYWVLNVKANASNFVTSTCLSKFPKQVTPAWWGRSPNARLMHTRQLSRVQ
ncbi:MAG: hypothetical protein ABI649_04700 [Gaiellaceae bacterium]